MFARWAIAFGLGLLFFQPWTISFGVNKHFPNFSQRHGPWCMDLCVRVLRNCRGLKRRGWNKCLGRNDSFFSIVPRGWTRVSFPSLSKQPRYTLFNHSSLAPRTKHYRQGSSAVLFRRVFVTEENRMYSWVHHSLTTKLTVKYKS